MPSAIAMDVQGLIAGTKKYKIVTVHEATDTILKADIQKFDSSVSCVRIVRHSNGITTISCPCRHWEDEGIPCSRAYFLIGYAALRLGLAKVWDIQSREWIHKALSMASLQVAYKSAVHFPSLNVPLLPPKEVMKGQMEKFGSLACYPGSFLPRKEYDTSKKIKTRDRNRRIGSWKEKRKGEIRDGDDEDDEDNLSEEFGLDLEQLRQVGQSESTMLSLKVDVFAGEKRKVRPMTCQRCGSNAHTSPTCGSEDISFLLHKVRVFPYEGKELPPINNLSDDANPTRFLSFDALCNAYPHLKNGQDSVLREASTNLTKSLELFHPGESPRQAPAPMVPGHRVSSLPRDVVELLRERLKEKKPGGVHAIAEAVQKMMRAVKKELSFIWESCKIVYEKWLYIHTRKAVGS